jgi:predicted DNA binding CopG/RHH family protein
LPGFLDPPYEESLGGFIVKEPKLTDLEVDEKATRLIRQKRAKAKSVKITINIDCKSLDTLRVKSAETGVPYQRLLNRFLKNGLETNSETESRLDRLEAEIDRLKKKVVA